MPATPEKRHHAPWNSRETLFAMVAVLLLGAAVHSDATENHGDYLITGRNGVVTVSHPVHGTWDGFIASSRPMQPPPARHTLQFEFIATNYFIPENQGHFAIAVTADAPGTHLIGHGVTIGNVAGYGVYPEGCVQSPPGNRVTIESFWVGGNCVWGEVSSSPELQNDTRYRLTLSASESAAGEPGKIVSYRLERFISPIWREIEHKTLFDPSPVPENYAGIFILEVFSTHEWEMRVENVTETLE